MFFWKVVCLNIVLIELVMVVIVLVCVLKLSWNSKVYWRINEHIFGFCRYEGKKLEISKIDLGYCCYCC
jgi:hypothetical protein